VESDNPTKVVDNPTKGGSRALPRVIGDVQLVPPRPSGTLSGRVDPLSVTGARIEASSAEVSSGNLRDEWIVVRGKRKSARTADSRSGPRSAGNEKSLTPLNTRGDDRKIVGGNSGHRPLIGRGRLPKVAAVSIRASSSEVSYASILKKARANFSLAELGVDAARVRDAANGGLIVEIPGPEGNTKADLLADKLRQVFGGDIKVNRPVKMGEVQLLGLDISVSVEEIQGVISTTCKCPLSEIRVGVPRRLADGTWAVWVQCPAVASDLSGRGRIVIGWAPVRVSGFRIKPTQCFRCWHFGHVRNSCRASVDRTGLCFRCGGLNHTVKTCKQEAKCMICLDNRLDHGHRLGSMNCPSVNIRRNRGVYDINGRQ